MVNTYDRVARESEVLRRITPEAMPIDEGLNASSMGATDAKYTEVMVDPQWIWGWKMLLDRNGDEYGVRVPLPRGQWDQGGINALNQQRWPDGRFCFQLAQPEREQPVPTVQCFVGDCRVKVYEPIELVAHIRTSHFTESIAYKTVLEQIEQKAIHEDPRLQAVLATLDNVGPSPIAREPVYGYGDESVYRCSAEGCSRFFDTAGGRDLHVRKAH